ncbi:MAG: site-specific integrase [Myxococcota bacterium]|nr:site-specific integrase [Myxococcota bacterium]
MDRSIVFVSPDLKEGERRQLRGVVLEAENKQDARWKFHELHLAAKRAVASGETLEFLDALDRRVQAAQSDSPMLKDFAEEWKENCVLGGGLTESTIESDLSILKNHLIPELGNLRLSEIDGRLIDRYKAKKRGQKHQYGKGYSAKTINNHLSVLHRIFEKAIEYGVAEKNPVTKRSWLKKEITPEENQNWWSPDEEIAAMRTLEVWKEIHPDLRLVILTQLITGMRFGEIRALEKRDLDLKTPGIWVRRSMARRTIGTPKNKKARFQVIPKGLADELRPWMLKIEGQLLFPGTKGGPLPNNTLNRAYRLLSDEAGIRPISSHGARHTSGSSYAYMGLGQKMIAALLGHTDVGTTARYTHVRVEATQPVVEARWARLVGRK